mmetsp:Transcript_6823/g.16654  ORF Transcript_6823/g.16654 Transcript_6823/m.16654 type:complete len:200 (-) Transcript_6823:93-692(-)
MLPVFLVTVRSGCIFVHFRFRTICTVRRSAPVPLVARFVAAVFATARTSTARVGIPLAAASSRPFLAASPSGRAAHFFFQEPRLPARSFPTVQRHVFHQPLVAKGAWRVVQAVDGGLRVVEVWEALAVDPHPSKVLRLLAQQVGDASPDKNRLRARVAVQIVEILGEVVVAGGFPRRSGGPAALASRRCLEALARGDVW